MIDRFYKTFFKAHQVRSLKIIQQSVKVFTREQENF